LRFWRNAASPAFSSPLSPSGIWVVAARRADSIAFAVIWVHHAIRGGLDGQPARSTTDGWMRIGAFAIARTKAPQHEFATSS
jgi:hypothetical protein